MSEREQIENIIRDVLDRHSAWVARPNRAVDKALADAIAQITPSPGYDHSGNNNHLVAGDHGPVITPQAGEWQQECGSIGLQHQCGRCGCEYRSPPPQAGEAEPVAWMEPHERGTINAQTKLMEDGWTDVYSIPLYRTAPPSPVGPVWQPKCDIYKVLPYNKDSGSYNVSRRGQTALARFVVEAEARFFARSMNALIDQYGTDALDADGMPLPSPPDSPGATEES